MALMTEMKIEMHRKYFGQVSVRKILLQPLRSGATSTVPVTRETNAAFQHVTHREDTLWIEIFRNLVVFCHHRHHRQSTAIDIHDYTKRMFGTYE